MSLQLIHDLLKNNAPRKQVYIPNLWHGKCETGLSRVNYADFLSEKIDAIKLMKTPAQSQRNVNWTSQAVVYNIFIRFFTAFDHNQDGKIGDNYNDLTLNDDGIRETGTFLKTIALLPYIKSLGVNTIHLLPITSIGKEGRKGDLGSPYSIKNPYKIESSLADPIINTTVDLQFRGLVEAANLLGIQVIQEFIFRTAAKDSDLIENHPEWFYWIKKNVQYGPPKFNAEDLKQIKKIPSGKGKHIPPSEKYRKKFAIPPKVPTEELKIAGAFADWPPDDLQPPWSDVTYLRLFNYKYEADNNYNYIAYNTIRYYDPKLTIAENVNHSLWQYIEQIIPYFQKKFGIQGAMIDMGHALPENLKKRIIRKVRKIDPSFAFWDENFENKLKTKSEGYNAVIGGAWYNIAKKNGFKHLILSYDRKQPLPFFGTAETHNSPRYGTGKKDKKIAAWILFNILPQSIPFVHNGFELNEKLPVNTGLNFSQNDLDQLADKRLPLFYKTTLNWNTNSHIISLIQKTHQLKESYAWIFDGKNLELVYTDNPRVLGFFKKRKHKEFLVLFNTNFYGRESFQIRNLSSKNWQDLINEKTMKLSLLLSLGPGKLLFLVHQ